LKTIKIVAIVIILLTCTLLAEGKHTHKNSYPEIGAKSLQIDKVPSSDNQGLLFSNNSDPADVISEGKDQRSPIGVGFGVGILYGITGFNIEIQPSDYFSAQLSIGSVLFEGPAFEFGGSFYFLYLNGQFCPRITVLYGTNDISDTGMFGSTEVFKNFSFGLGAKMFISDNSAFNLDFFYPLTPDGDKYRKAQKDLGKKAPDMPQFLLFSIGFHYNF
jgi:hypothetical protein